MELIAAANKTILQNNVTIGRLSAQIAQEADNHDAIYASMLDGNQAIMSDLKASQRDNVVLCKERDALKEELDHAKFFLFGCRVDNNRNEGAIQDDQRTIKEQKQTIEDLNKDIVGLEAEIIVRKGDHGTLMQVVDVINDCDISWEEACDKIEDIVKIYGATPDPSYTRDTTPQTRSNGPTMNAKDDARDSMRHKRTIDELRAERDTLVRAISKYTEDMQDMEIHINALRTDVSDRNRHINELVAHIKDFNQQISEHKETIKILRMAGGDMLDTIDECAHREALIRKLVEG